jgi:hypothetical protein
MPKTKKPAFVSHADVASNWNIRSNGVVGGLKLTYNAIAGRTRSSKKIDASTVVGKDVASGKIVVYEDDHCSDRVGVELDIIRWTVYDDTVYVQCANEKFYRLFMYNVNHAVRDFTQSKLITMLSSSKVEKIEN